MSRVELKRVRKPAPAWRALDVGPIAAGELRATRVDEFKLVVGRRQDGTLFALDNRCPHEGYPLSEGTLKDGLLTCAWHNWKFEVSSGACKLGGEDVHHYSVRESGEGVEIDLAEPDPAIVIEKTSDSLRQGLHDHDNGRVMRDALRLLQVGVEPWQILRDVAAYDARHAEYGTTHVLPVAVDCGRLVLRFEGLERLHALAPALDLCGDACRRLPRRAAAEPVPCEPAVRVGDEIRRAVEDEDLARAEGLLRFAVRQGASGDEALAWILAPVADHFLDFGHALIYWVRLAELLEESSPERGDSAEEDLLAALLHRVVLGTREDTLPYWKPYADRVGPALEEIARSGLGTGTVDAPSLRVAVLDGDPGSAVAAVRDALQAGSSPSEVALALVEAAAERFLRFDPAIDADAGVAENWLWVTHRFTFTSAVRQALELCSSDELRARLLFQAVAFINSGSPMDEGDEGDEADKGDGKAAPAFDEEAAREELIEAVRRRNADRAVAIAGRMAETDAGGAELLDALRDFSLTDPLVHPLFLAHAIKTITAAAYEWDALAGRPGRALPVLATVRFLASPIDERRVRQNVERSIAWVGEGKTPRKLTQ